MKRRIIPFVENIGESTAACLLLMVQGNLMALTPGHWVIASQTGFIAGIAASLALLLTRTDRRWIIAFVLGAVTVVVDYLVHSQEPGSAVIDAVVTGIGAAILSFGVGAAILLVSRRRAG